MSAEMLARQISISGRRAFCDRCGALWFADLSLLVVSDLHLEKGSSFARHGQFLPPYDTAETLRLLGELILHYDPRMVISLGDSFHDGYGHLRMMDIFHAHLSSLMKGRNWYWIAGNHDPQAPASLGGESAQDIRFDGLIFRHEPSLLPEKGEIAGHLHPGARVVHRGRSVRRRCFASDGKRLIMPAFGAFTGTLNVLDRAYQDLFDWQDFRAHLLGHDRIYSFSSASLRPG